MITRHSWSKSLPPSRSAQRNQPTGGRQRSKRLAFETLESRIVLASMVADINTESLASSEPANLVDVGGVLFFTATDTVHGEELWKSDGTAAGTVLVKDLDPGDWGSDPAELTNVNGTLYLSAWAPWGPGYTDGVQQLIKSDGTPEGTVAVQSGTGFGIAVYPSSLTNINGLLFFRGMSGDGDFTTELWRSDGTSAGTFLLTHSPTSFIGSTQDDLTLFNDMLFFSHWVDEEELEDRIPPALWKSDGTVEGTMLVKSVIPMNLAVANNTLFFSAFDFDSATGRELWKSDGTTEGTLLVKDIHPGTAHSSPSELVDVDGTLFFLANDGTSGEELWKSDGSEEGTVLVKDINLGSGGSIPSNLINIGGTLYFLADDGLHGRELWMSDGTAEGTAMVKDIRPGSAGSHPAELTNVNGKLYFRANDGARGYELWKSDGTPEGTVIAAEIVPGGGDGDPRELTAIGADLYFTADDGIHGRELWILRTDNLAPSADPGGPYQIQEGDELRLDASASSDPNADPLSFSWDLSGDGDFSDADGPMPMLTWAELMELGIDDSGSYTGSVRVTDGQGGVSEATVVLIILNTPPMATLTSESTTAGEPVIVTFTDPSDASPADTAAGFRYAYALDADALESVSYADGSTTAASWSFTGLTAGTHTIYARIIDQDDGFSAYSSVIQVPVRVLSPQEENESIDLSARLEEDLAGVGLVDLRGFGVNLLTLDAERIETLFAGGSVMVIADPEDSLVFDGLWSFAGVELIEGEIFRQFSQGGATLRLQGPLAFTNPINRFDVNASGSVIPLDALLILNALRGAPVQFIDGQSVLLPLTEETAAAYKFFDVNGDGLLTPLDALLVINEIGRINRTSMRPESAPLTVVPAPEQRAAALRQVATDDLDIDERRIEHPGDAASYLLLATSEARPAILLVADKRRQAESDGLRPIDVLDALVDEALADPLLLA